MSRKFYLRGMQEQGTMVDKWKSRVDYSYELYTKKLSRKEFEKYVGACWTQHLHEMLSRVGTMIWARVDEITNCQTHGEVSSHISNEVEYIPWYIANSIKYYSNGHTSKYYNMREHNVIRQSQDMRAQLPYNGTTIMDLVIRILISSNNLQSSRTRTKNGCSMLLCVCCL